MMIDFTVEELIKQTRRKDANPGGGALVSLIGNLAINLLLMMDKKDYGDENLDKEAKKHRTELLAISKRLEEVMQEDIDNISSLLEAYKNNEDKKSLEKKTLKAIEPPKNTIDLVLRAMEVSSFFLENGKLSTISDGEIGLRLMREAVMSSIINIEINQKQVFYEFDKKAVIEKCQKLYDSRKRIIEGRKQ